MYQIARWKIGYWIAATSLLMSTSLVSAEDLTSANFIQRGGSFAAAAHPALASSAPTPEFTFAGSSLGDGFAALPVGSAVNLSTLLPGFWTIVAGAFPNLDIDGDLAQYFLDDDDDGDGLDDIVETRTKIFLSAFDTGTSPVDSDSDDDGFSDGAEVLSESDPNNAGSTPLNPKVPVSGLAGRGLLVVLLMLVVTIAGVTRRRVQ